MSAATLVLAPGLFSTMIDCLNSLPRKSATLRPRISVAPPAANGMISRIGRSGYSARAADGSSIAAAQNAPMARAERPAQPLISPSKFAQGTLPSFRPSEARAGIHNHDTLGFAPIERLVVMDSGLAHAARPGMTASYSFGGTVRR